jgi:putative chitinase
MFKFNRNPFFNHFRTRFGPLSQELVDALEFLLGQIEGDERFAGTDTDRRQLAYCLATFKWETAHTMLPIDEFGSDAYFNTRYGPQTTVGKRLGNTQAGDGARFHGRGFVQLTGRSNYARAGAFTGADLIDNPQLAKDRNLAYHIAVQGMKEGWFTGRRLGRYIHEGAPPDYEGARAIINRQDKAQTIADIARRFDEVLAFSSRSV